MTELEHFEGVPEGVLGQGVEVGVRLGLGLGLFEGGKWEAKGTFNSATTGRWSEPTWEDV